MRMRGNGAVALYVRGIRVDLLAFVDVDRPSRVAVQAGIEEARLVWNPGPPGERELHGLRVRHPVQSADARNCDGSM